MSKLGETKIMNCGLEAEIIKYKASNNIAVKFIETNEVVENIQYSNFKKGTIKSHFTPTVYGVGVTGLENTKDSNGKKLRSYKCWVGMLERGYNNIYKEKHPTYKDCTVCEEWLIYSNFKKWYDDNYYEILDLGRTELDKDILFKGNKMYSPDTCIFVPHRINSLFLGEYFTKNKNNLPSGIIERNNRYVTLCRDGTNQKYLGTFDKLSDAIQKYNEFKIEIVDSLLSKYSNKLPRKLSIAMKNYYLNGGQNE